VPTACAVCRIVRPSGAPASGLHRLPRLPAHAAGLTPDSSRKLLPSSSAVLPRPRLAPQAGFFDPASDRFPACAGRLSSRYSAEPAFGLRRRLFLGATGAEPPAFTGRRISSLRWRPASVFRQKPDPSSFPGLLVPGLRRKPSPPVPLAD